MKPSYYETAELSEYLIVPLKKTVLLPGMSISVEIVNDDVKIKEMKRVHVSGASVLALPMDTDADGEDEHTEGDFGRGMATLALVQQLIRLSDGRYRALLIGYERAELVEVSESKGYGRAIVRCIAVDGELVEAKAMLREANSLVAEYIKYMPSEAKGLKDELESITDIGAYADRAAASLLWNYGEKLRILSEVDPVARMNTFLVMMNESLELLVLQSKLRREVKKRVDKNQRDYYLTEQLHAIREELGEGSDVEAEADEYIKRIEASGAPDDVADKLKKEAQKLKRMPFSSVEYGVTCNYLDVCLDFPWSNATDDRTDIKLAKKILDRDHDGLDKVKERIIEYLAVRQLSPGLGNQIICLVGPPGTGKTSIARSVAEAVGRNYIRVSLGGVRDESDIRGHRKTYVGAMPGRIVSGLIKAGSKNPLMLLDEIDKLTRDAHGDPASALMEVLDAEQNKTFRDHFMEVETDLSGVMFIATANTLETVPRPLLDRMEIIELKSYSAQEKLSIAKHHLIPKQLAKHGMTKKQLKINEGAVKTIINGYTHEAGVRGLEREIAAVCRKVAERLLEGEEQVEVTAKNVQSFIGAERFIPERIYDEDEVGVVNGLAYTELGGSLLKVEVAAMPGSGKVELTGSLGDVMKESAKTAVTYIRSHAEELEIDGRFYKDKDIHFHFPEGAVPKDGPSAGVTMVCALVSELSGKPVKNDVAMTGEVTLRGRILPIGGLKEKTMAAYKAGVKTVLIPEDNSKDLNDIDPYVKERLEFVPCRMVGDVLKNALVP